MDKKYGVILADPPWDYRNGGNGYAGTHYPLMTPGEIAKLPIGDLANERAVLILWTTWPQIEGAIKVIKTWGFSFVTGFPWIKLHDPPMIDLFQNVRGRPVFGTGAWVRGCSEPILIAKRGKAKPPAGFHWLGLLGERMEHSRKPESIHQYAESFPGPYLELFARRPREGWDVWGNEVESTVEINAVSGRALVGCLASGKGQNGE